MTFLNGTLDGLRKLYYADYGIYTYQYKKGLLSKSKFYDTLNILRYESPLDLKSIAKMTYNFSSNRSYFDQDKVDTITIITKGLPYYNRGISITGATITAGVVTEIKAIGFKSIEKFGTFSINLCIL